MGIFQAIVLGLVQGLSEFLPISSSAHLRIVPALFGWADPGAAFSAIIQLGTLAAVLVYFYHDIIKILSAWFTSLKTKIQSPESKLAWAIIYGTIPIGIIGLGLQKKIEGPFRSLYLIGASLIIFSLILAWAEKIAEQKRELKDLASNDGWWAGLAQSLAIIPGASRSGTTITGNLLLGFNRETAARFSFLLSIPSVLLSGLYELFKVRHELGSTGGTANVIIATIISFVFGYFSIAYFLKYLKTNSTKPFIIYRLILGFSVIFLAAAGIIR